MKAWRVEKHGPPNSVRWGDVPDPRPGTLAVRIRVEAVGLNHLDLWVCKGVEGHKFPLPLTPGCDVSGTVEAFGLGSEDALRSSGITLGSPVILNPGTSCGRCEACLGGFDPVCPSYGILGETQDGGCAELVCAPVTNVLPRPPSLSPAQAAALPIPYLTAWTMLLRKSQLKPGEKVLIQAGGSGVSIAAIQIAKLFGATVLTTVGSEQKAAQAKALGADHVILYRNTPFREEVRKIVGKRGVEVVIDHVGSDTFSDSLKCLAWGGRLATCGATSGSKVELDLKPIFFKNISIFGSTMGSKADLLRIVELAAQRKLPPVIDSVLPMSALPQALERIERREPFGKIILSNG